MATVYTTASENLKTELLIRQLKWEVEELKSQRNRLRSAVVAARSYLGESELPFYQGMEILNDAFDEM